MLNTIEIIGKLSVFAFCSWKEYSKHSNPNIPDMVTDSQWKTCNYRGNHYFITYFEFNVFSYCIRISNRIDDIEDNSKQRRGVPGKFV